MTKEKAITIIESHKAHWQRLLREKICDEIEGRETIEGFDMAISALSENKGEWIPVSESLPEEREWYLAVFKEKDTDFQLIPRVADYIGHGENKWQLMDEEKYPQEYRDLLECVAWMPLPEPYSAGRKVSK